ncbi:hypothetical protein ACJJTC_007141 [Scirpophaga incertulas]
MMYKQCLDNPCQQVRKGYGVKTKSVEPRSERWLTDEESRSFYSPQKVIWRTMTRSNMITGIPLRRRSALAVASLVRQMSFEANNRFCKNGYACPGCDTPTMARKTNNRIEIENSVSFGCAKTGFWKSGFNFVWFGYRRAPPRMLLSAALGDTSNALSSILLGLAQTTCSVTWSRAAGVALSGSSLDSRKGCGAHVNN